MYDVFSYLRPRQVALDAAGKSTMLFGSLSTALSRSGQRELWPQPPITDAYYDTGPEDRRNPSIGQKMNYNQDGQKTSEMVLPSAGSIF